MFSCIVALQALCASIHAENRTVRLRIADNFTQLPVANAHVLLDEIHGPKNTRHPSIASQGATVLTISNSSAQYQFEVTAENYGSYRSARFTFEESKPLHEITLERLFDFEGVIIAPTGQFASGAQYFLCTDLTEVTFRPDRTFFTRSRAPGVTGSKGRFTLAPDATGHSIVVAHDLGYAFTPLLGWTNGSTIRLKPWVRVSGRMLVNGIPAAAQNIALRPADNALGRTRMTLLDFDFRTDAQGRFQFENVPPGDAVLAWKSSSPDGNTVFTHRMPFVADSLKQDEIVYDLTGSKISGRLRFENADPIELNQFTVSGQIITKMKSTEFPLELWKPGSGSAGENNSFAVTIDKDLTFRAAVIPPGEHTLRVTCSKNVAPGSSARIQSFRATLHVPPGADLNLGEIILQRDR